MRPLYPALGILVVIDFMKERCGSSSCMVASAVLVRFPPGVPVSGHSDACNALQEAARRTAPGRSGKRTRRRRRRFRTGDMERAGKCAGRHELASGATRSNAFAARSTCSVVKRGDAGESARSVFIESGLTESQR